MNQAGYILLVEDGHELRLALQEVLEKSRYHVTAAANAIQAREAMANGKFDLSILDIQLPDGNGLELLREFHNSDNDMGVIMMTAFADVDMAVDAIRMGADDFIKKPFDMEELLVRIEELLKKYHLRQENKVLNHQVHALRGQKTMIGQSDAITKIHDVIELLADSDSTILINGESGTGKGASR